MYVVKLAVALILAGGVQRIDPNGTKVRGKPLFLWLLALTEHEYVRICKEKGNNDGMFHFLLKHEHTF